MALALALIALAGSCGKEDLYEIPDSPYPLVGRLPLPSINESVAVIGDYAFVAAVRRACTWWTSAIRRRRCW